MRILLTGGSGFIGSHLARQLRGLGHELVNLDLYEPADPALFQRCVIGDVRNPVAARAAVTGCDAVFHLAAAHHDFGIKRETFFDVNENGTGVLCQAMSEAGVKRLCFYSSVAVYGNAPAPHLEDAAKDPAAPYGASKLAGEAVCTRWASSDAANELLIVRPTVVFGVGNMANFYALIRQIHSRRYVQVGAGTNRKSVAYVENLIDALIFLWDQRRARGVSIYNFIDKPDLGSAQIASIIYRALGRSETPLRIPLWAALIAVKPFDWIIAATGRNLAVSSARVRKFADSETVYEAQKLQAAGFVPRMTIEQGLTRMVEWYVAQGHAMKAVAHLPPEAADMKVREI